MDDDGFRRAIQRGFACYEMSADATLPIGRRQSIPAAAAAHSRRLPRLAMPLLAAAAAAAVLAIAIAPPPTAFASWRATPADADPAVVASAQSSCTGSDADHLAGLRLVASEQRGDYTMLLFGDGKAYGLCLTGADIAPMVLAGPGTGAVDAPGGPALVGDGHGGSSVPQARGVRFVAQPGSGSSIAKRVQAWVVGVTPDVTRVVIERDGAEPIVATLGDGVAFAWWPAGTEAATIAAYDANGVLLQRIPTEGFGSHITEQ